MSNNLEVNHSRILFLGKLRLPFCNSVRIRAYDKTTQMEDLFTVVTHIQKLKPGFQLANRHIRLG